MLVSDCIDLILKLLQWRLYPLGGIIELYNFPRPPLLEVSLKQLICRDMAFVLYRLSDLLEHKNDNDASKWKLLAETEDVQVKINV